MQYNEPLQQPVQPQQPYYAPAAEQPAQQPYYAPAAEQPVQQPYYATAAEQPAQQPYYAPAPEQAVAGNAWQAEEQQSTLLHSLHTRLSKLISSQPLRNRCTNSRNLLNSSLLWSLNPL
ncbi:hypothetical protein [Escherichia coli]|uniref:hypothetical protein n=1 Tax=Escherichia coli TaxID=562 RepID=UPI003F4D7E20